jgi:hypothetical protein
MVGKNVTLLFQSLERGVKVRGAGQNAPPRSRASEKVIFVAARR